MFTHRYVTHTRRAIVIKNLLSLGTKEKRCGMCYLKYKGGGHID